MRDPEASRAVAENHIFSREAHWHTDAINLRLYVTILKMRNALATRQRPVRRERVAFPRAETHLDVSRTCKIGASYRSRRLIPEISRPTFRGRSASDNIVLIKLVLQHYINQYCIKHYCINHYQYYINQEIM